MARLFVLDALGLAYRAYYAFISRPLTNSRHENTSAIFGFGNTVLKLRREEKPDYWALAWDGPGPTFRHERFPDYKAQRKPTPADLISQLEPIEQLAQALGLPVIEIPGTEADDVMATLARRGVEAGHDVVLVTGDKDMLQVVGEHVKVLTPQSRDEYLWLDAAGVVAKWGVEPGQFRDVLALMGDSSDNIPGVPGIGEKTAVELIRAFGSLDQLYRRLDEVKKPALKAKLEAHRDMAMLSRELATVRDDLDLPHTWEDLRCAPIRRDALREFARHHEIRRLESVAEELGVADGDAGALAPACDAARRGTVSETPAPGVRLADPPAAGRPAPPAPPLPMASAPAAPARPALPAAMSRPGPNQGTLDLWATAGAEAGPAPPAAALAERVHAVRARALHGLAVQPLLAGDAPRRATLVGLALAARDGTTCYLPIAHEAGGNFALEQVREWLALAFADESVPKVGEDLKRDVHALEAAALPLEGLEFDVHLGSFLCDPSRDHGLAALARDVLGEALPALEPPPARGRARPTLAQLPVAASAAAAERAAAALHRLHEALRAQLEARDQWKLYRELEHPLIGVLVDMERAGVGLDVRVLGEMSLMAAADITRLRQELVTLAGEEINLESGPQVAKVLFEKLGLKPGGKTPGGALSTRSDVLEELAAAHPFPARLLEYRVLTKLQSTYLEALPLGVDPADGRVHTTFEQTGAATGRLASRDPNLQNIPMRTPLGRAIRRAFVAPPGRQLVGADYSQIELRVMAHLSGDARLIAAFESGEDVHANTARQIFSVGKGALDPALRARAKIVNFGVMYGMGARSLSQQMGIGLAEAQEFIQGYFRVYAGVREFLDGTLEEARRSGYVKTLLGRRRYLPELASGHGGARALAERAAINTPIQGSAADLMKLAMVRVHRALPRVAPSARLLLQVHDELLLECDDADGAVIGRTVRAEMEGCFPLRVPLQVSLGAGPTWFDVH